MKKIILSAIITILSVVSAYAQDQKYTWVEVQCVELHKDTMIEHCKTDKGVDKFWINLKQIDGPTTKVYVSPTNYFKFCNEEIILELVEWYSVEKDEYKYSTRQKKIKSNKKVDLTKL